MTQHISFIIEGQQMPPENTAVMNSLIEAITNTELSTSLGKTALLNPSVIEVALGVDDKSGENDFLITSWHETSGPQAARWQVRETRVDVVNTLRGIQVVSESGRLYGLSKPQLACGAALIVTAAIGYDYRRQLQAKDEKFPPFPFGIN